MKTAQELLWRCPYSLRRRILASLKPAQAMRFRNLRSSNDELDSLQPFVNKRAIFVHIPKTAGISVCYSLFGGLAGGHKRIREYCAAFSKEEFESFYKFAFVRHPADRLCSAFRFLRKGGRSKEDARYGQEALGSYRNEDDFVKNGLSRESLHDYLHFVPQYEFLRTWGIEPRVDFIGRFENLEEDFETIRRQVGGEPLKKLNSSERQKTWEKILSDESRERIGEVYAEDYELFDYKV